MDVLREKIRRTFVSVTSHPTYIPPTQRKAYPSLNQQRSQPKILGGYFYRKRTTVFCLEHCFSKHKMTRYARDFAGLSPWLRLCSEPLLKPRSADSKQRVSSSKRRRLVFFLNVLQRGRRLVRAADVRLARRPLGPLLHVPQRAHALPQHDRASRSRAPATEQEQPPVARRGREGRKGRG